MKKIMRALSIILTLILSQGENLLAQSSDQIIVVPADASDPSMPHIAHEGASITLKAILRNTSGTTYSVAWDINFDGTFSPSETFNVGENPTVNGVRDIGRIFTTPGVTSDQIKIINIKVVNLSNMSERYAAYYLKILNWTPDQNPAYWTDDQIDVMQEMAIQENMWYLHKQLAYLEGAGVATMKGRYGHANTDTHVLDIFTGNGHFPAYPPGTINNYGYTLPANWSAENNWRWDHDPYAETALRIMNYQLATLSSQTIGTGSEDSTVGYYPNGSQVLMGRIPGTTNNKCIKTSLAPNDAGVADGNAQMLTGFVKTLPSHYGVPVQVGGTGILGKPMEYVVQEMIDYIVYHQIDGGTGLGGFHYNPFEGSSNLSMGESTAGVARGLQDAQRYQQLYGVVVNNKVKYRMAENICNQQGSDYLVKRFGSYSGSNNNFNYTAGYLAIGHWLGADQFSPSDNMTAFPGYSTKTRGQLRTAYDHYFTTSIPLWNSNSKLDPYNWLDHFWQNGDYLSGSPTGIYNQNLGSTFNMFGWAQGLANCSDTLEAIGVHDWKREMAIHLLRGQNRDGNSSFYGRYADNYCTASSHSCSYHPPYWSSVLGGRALMAIHHEGYPRAMCNVMPTQVAAGDSILLENAGSYTLTKFDILSYQWDLDDSNGLWWETGDTADFSSTDSSASHRFAYSAAGAYTVTFRVQDNSGNFSTVSNEVTVISPQSPPGNCLSFDGETGYAHIDNTAGLKPTGAFTLEAWVYVDSTVTGASILDNGYATAGGISKCGGFNLGVLSAASKRYSFWVCNGQDLSSDQVIIDSDEEYQEDAWNHVAAVNTGSELILYVNGAEQGRTAFTGNVDYTYVDQDPAYGVNIGCYKDDDEDSVFCGMIDEVRIWGDARTAQEIRDNMCRSLAGGEDNLEAYYRFDYISGAVMMDDFSPGDNYAYLESMDSSSAWLDSEAYNTWSGAVDSVWHNTANWSDGTPASNGNIGIISSSNDPFVSVKDTCRNLVISNGATLTVLSDSLQVDLHVINEGQIIVKDTLLNNQSESLFINDGTVSNDGFIMLNRIQNNPSGSILVKAGKDLIIE